MGFLDSSVVFLIAQQVQRPLLYEKRHHQRLETWVTGVYMASSITGGSVGSQGGSG